VRRLPPPHDANPGRDHHSAQPASFCGPSAASDRRGADRRRPVRAETQGRRELQMRAQFGFSLRPRASSERMRASGRKRFAPARKSPSRFQASSAATPAPLLPLQEGGRKGDMSAKIVPISNKGRKENVEYRTQNRRMSKEILELRHSTFGVVIRYSPYLTAMREGWVFHAGKVDLASPRALRGAHAGSRAHAHPAGPLRPVRR